TVGWGDGDEPADVETTLRAALADPALRVAYLIDGQWLDVRGTPLALPELGHTLVTDDDEPIAAVIRGGVRTADDGLLEAALEGVRLGLDAERILAVESRRVAVLEAARITAAEAAETARLRLERDLHDGAQQRIVSLRFALGVARSRAERERATALVTVVDEADQAGARALDQVR